MDTVWSKLLFLVAGAVIVEAIRHSFEFVKKITPKIEYSVSSGIPVKVGDMHYGAHELKVQNPSRKKAENVTLHLRSSNNSLKIEVLSKPDGFEYRLTDKEKDGEIELSFPYLKGGERFSVRAQAESKYFFSDSLGVSVSSPNDIEATRISESQVKDTPIFGAPFAFFGGAFVAIAIVFVHTIWVDLNRSNQTATTFQVFQLDTRDIIISAASNVGLPHIAELYFAAPEPKYYDEGGLAYSLAVASNKPEEIEKYRRLLSLTLETGPSIASESQANLYYSLGRLDLLISDETSALSDFKSAIEKNKSTVESQAKADTKTRKYLIDHGLL
jgi:hypothetical protein